MIRLIRKLQRATDHAILEAYAEVVAAHLGVDLARLRTVGLEAQDFTKTVHVSHHDGSTLAFHWAFAVASGDYVAVFTEHHGYHLFHREDIKSYREEPAG